ncbi:MAG TPA: sulfotransferase, partial [Verrucomicrobiae bacterium]|nr:sulfotransferase [Verrucomicrobiae bacterium]
MKSTYSGPVFVVGFFRSGTSLLYSLLNQHPRIGLMYECDVWDFPDACADLRFEQNWLARQEFYNRALSRHRLIFGGSLRGLEQVRTVDDLYRTFSASKGAELWGEKSPQYCVRLRRLARRYPGATFLLLWRNPVDIFRSVAWAAQKDRYFARPGMFTRFVYYQEQMILQAAWLSRAGHRVCHVQYDALVDHTESVCSDICAFLGIDFDKQMLDLTRADFSAVYQGRHHEHLRRATIQRQEYPEEVLPPVLMDKLARFGARWDRLQRERLGFQKASGHFREPGALSRMHYLGVGF